jgi:hypothetical protein
MQNITMSGETRMMRIKILWTERAEFPKGWGIKRHAHQYFHLFYIIEGTSRFLIDDREYEAVPNTCFIMAPGVYHELAKVQDGSLQVYEIKFLVQDQAIADNLDLKVPVFSGDTFFDTAIPYIVKNGRSRNPYYSQNAQDFLSSLLAHISDRSAFEDAPDSEMVDTAGFHEATVETINFIN